MLSAWQHSEFGLLEENRRPKNAYELAIHVPIRRANMDGTGIKDVVDAGLSVLDVALDPVHGNVYWTPSFDGRGLGHSNWQQISNSAADVPPGPKAVAPDIQLRRTNGERLRNRSASKVGFS